ncbi:MAG: helix-turn-helix domain-containing protein [Myxococcota bacterium]
MPDSGSILRVVNRLLGADAELSLQTVADVGGWSRFHLHRDFRAVVGETPKQFQRRQRLQHALALLATSDLPIHEVATAAGFGSHAGFTRRVRATLGCAPTTFRARTRGTWTPEHARRLERSGRCIGLHGLGRPKGRPTMTDVRLETRHAQPILFVRRRVAPSELAATFAECLPRVFQHCQVAGLPIAGAPFARYPEVGRGLLTVECGMPIVAPADGVDDIESGELAGGEVAVAVHHGAYETLHETHAAVERWLTDQGRTAGDGPWESYVTDPADHPDPADWRTEVCWPVGR